MNFISKYIKENYILNNFCEIKEIPNIWKYMSSNDVLDDFLEIEEQLVAEYLVYGEVEL